MYCTYWAGQLLACLCMFVHTNWYLSYLEIISGENLELCGLSQVYSTIGSNFLCPSGLRSFLSSSIFKIRLLWLSTRLTYILCKSLRPASQLQHFWMSTFLQMEIECFGFLALISWFSFLLQDMKCVGIQ